MAIAAVRPEQKILRRTSIVTHRAGCDNICIEIRPRRVPLTDAAKPHGGMDMEDMKLAETKIADYLELLGSDAPAPGGGAAAALSGAQGAALVMMVANHTIGKKKYAEFEELNVRVRDEAAGLLEKLTAGIDEDRDAFKKVSAAYGMPKAGEDQKRARADAIASASVGAADAPLAAMRAAVRALELTGELMGKSNKNLVSDLYTAALHLLACIESAKYNVEANIPYIRDKELAGSMKKESDAISEECGRLVPEILGRRL
jgi:formiminotetrahydrofolate cyclodeaminase